MQPFKVIPIKEMNNAALNEVITKIRARREEMVNLYLMEKQMAIEAERAKAGSKVAKKIEQLDRGLDQLERKVEQLSRWLVELQAYRLQAGMED